MKDRVKYCKINVNKIIARVGISIGKIKLSPVDA